MAARGRGGAGRLSGLRFGPLPAATLHVCVDMQRMFHAGTSWAGAAVAAALPAAVAVTRAMPERTVLTRFVTPRTPADASGAWRRYYERWSDVLLDRMPEEMLDVVPELAAFAPPAVIVDKPTYSAFGSPHFRELLAARHPEALILTGVETEVCVLATLWAAVDHGYRCVVVTDATTSPDDDAHRTTLDVLTRRLGDQVELVTAADLLA